jgi:MOSC domain-containing protein YiiM
VRAGDPIEVVDRPSRGISIADAFRIYMHEPSELKRLLEAEGLSAGLRADVEERLSRARP